MRRLRKHIDRLNIVHAIVLRQRLQIFRKRGWIAGNVDKAFRFDFLIVSKNVLSQPVLGGSNDDVRAEAFFRPFREPVLGCSCYVCGICHAVFFGVFLSIVN